MAVSVSVDTSGFRKRYTRYIEDVKAQLASDWEEVTAVCLADVAKRAPSPEAEHDFIQGYEGGTRSDTKSIKPESERISFIRGPGTWLQELVLSPTTYISNPSTLQIDLGLVGALEAGSTFSWQNYNKKNGPMLHTSPYGVFSWFEYGKVATQSALFGKYKLKDDDVAFWTSTKTYPRLGMYTLFPTSIFKEAVYTSAKKVQF